MTSCAAARGLDCAGLSRRWLEAGQERTHLQRNNSIDRDFLARAINMAPDRKVGHGAMKDVGKLVQQGAVGRQVYVLVGGRLDDD